MLALDDLGLTPGQLAEIAPVDPNLIEKWLVVASRADVRNPAGLFLTGVRSGNPPDDHSDVDRARQVRLAERWILNAGIFCDELSSVTDELLDGPRARLRPWREDLALRGRIISLWERHRPDGVQVEQESRERAQRWKEARKKMQES